MKSNNRVAILQKQWKKRDHGSSWPFQFVRSSLLTFTATCWPPVTGSMHGRIQALPEGQVPSSAKDILQKFSCISLRKYIQLSHMDSTTVKPAKQSAGRAVSIGLKNMDMSGYQVTYTKQGQSQSRTTMKANVTQRVVDYFQSDRNLRACLRAVTSIQANHSVGEDDNETPCT